MHSPPLEGCPAGRGGYSITNFELRITSQNIVIPIDIP